MSHGTDANQAGLQGFGYRRGFVLGLTLAEAALLLVFVIMLLMIAGFERRDRTIAALESLRAAAANAAPAGVEPISYAAGQLEKMAALRSAAESTGHVWDEDFIELVKAVASTTNAAELVDVRKALQEKEARLEHMMAAFGELEDGASLTDLLERVADSESMVSNQRGQIAALRDQLSRDGLGGVLPSCWTTPEGRIDYLFDVVLTSGGIRLRESFPATRQAERDRLPLGSVSSGRVYSQSEFQALTRAVFDWSVARECRFYVTVFDGTQGHEKERYKSLLTTVEGHFYKRLSNSAPPF